LHDDYVIADVQSFCVSYADAARVVQMVRAQANQSDKQKKPRKFGETKKGLFSVFFVVARVFTIAILISSFCLVGKQSKASKALKTGDVGKSNNDDDDDDDNDDDEQRKQNDCARFAFV
jgi:hypothetical protein